MAKPLCILLKDRNPEPIAWEEKDGIAFKVLTESLTNPSAFGNPNY